VKKIRISSGADLQSMFAAQPLHPGILTRVEGRVVADDGCALAGPFSERQCVFYSASVSQQRHDGIIQPPLAFHSAGADFVVELKDAPHIRLLVSSSDVALFNMSKGLQEKEEIFSVAPKGWCGFVLEHMLPSPDASAHFKNCLDLGSDGVALEFRECALLAGSMVTCVGQVTRDRNGALRLLPWKPQLAAPGAEESRGSAEANEPWLSLKAKAMPWLDVSK
ncbi:unnamed protein product, partial [Polarella glacialis]